MARPIVAANWKMHKTQKETEQYLKRLLEIVPRDPFVELVVFPPFTGLPLAARLLEGSPISFGAQNAHPEKEGAYTGEVSMAQVADLGARYVICGHSERRRIFGESDGFVAAKVWAAWRHDLIPILCVGETLEERRGNFAWETVERQLSSALPELGGPLVIAYEPVWAIGTGVPAHPGDVQEMARAIRFWLGERFGEEGGHVRLQYGGSVSPQNARDFLTPPGIDGALVGGASLDPQSFWSIAQASNPDHP